jgi:two-component sensor histidine kinase
MSILHDRFRSITDLDEEQVRHLVVLCSSWQVLADLSFSDLLLYVRVRGEEKFEIAAQLRPFTSQTLYPTDMVGTVVTQPEQPIVERAFREGRIWQQDDPVLVDGIPIRMDAVPVRFNGETIAVVTKEGSPATSRRLGRLEQVYLQAAHYLSEMIALGRFPFRGAISNDWPRVGDGLMLSDNGGRVSWASPNALSALRRLGVKENVLGRYLDELGLGRTPVSAALLTARLMDGELSRSNNVVALRVLPLVSDVDTFGALVLLRDVSELRQKERVISVKDATIREIHHRVKNNLQTIASLLRLQARRLTSDEAKGALHESVLRIGSIALVHETLSEGPSDVAEFGDVVRRITRMVAEGLMLPDSDVEMKVVGTTGPIGADVATPLAVSVTELMQNAMEHAFPGDRTGTVAVELAHSDDEIKVVVWDDGVGLPDEVPEGARLGLQIVRALIGELGGEFSMSSNGGTRAEMTIPKHGP